MKTIILGGSSLLDSMNAQSVKKVKDSFSEIDNNKTYVLKNPYSKLSDISNIKLFEKSKSKFHK